MEEALLGMVGHDGLDISYPVIILRTILAHLEMPITYPDEQDLEKGESRLALQVSHSSFPVYVRFHLANTCLQ